MQNETKKTLTPQALTKLIASNQQFRKALASSSLFWFAHIYFGSYMHYATADFQRDMYRQLEDELTTFIGVLGFRGCTKTTIGATILPIYKMVTGKKRYPIIIGETLDQSKKHLYNLRYELETNDLLIKDWGPFKPVGASPDGIEEWHKTTLVVDKYNARISAHSYGQSIRGLRHRDRRPDLVICDDLESIKSVRSKVKRRGLYEWFTSEVLSIGGKAPGVVSQVVVFGNLLHSDGLMRTLEKAVETGKITGKFLRYMFFDETAPKRPEYTGLTPRWWQKFKSQEDIEVEKRKLGNERIWLREMEGKIVPEDGQEVKEEWIKTYKNIPAEFKHNASGTGVDLAISKSSTADSTAGVGGLGGVLGATRKIYIKPHPLNEKLTLLELTSKLKVVQSSDPWMQFFVENVAYQAAAIEVFKREGINARAVKPIGDKRARLQVVAPLIQDGTIEFAETGCEELIDQLVNFGVAEHDDLVDAFVYLVLGLSKSHLSTTEVVWL